MFQGGFILIETLLNTIGYSAASMKSATAGSTTLSMLLYVGIIGSVVEELVYRGFVMRALEKHGKVLVIVASSLFFGLMHANIPQSIFAVFSGLVLGYVAMRYSIVWSIALHILNNLVFGDLLSWAISGLSETMQIIICYAVMGAFFVAGLIVLIVKRKDIRSYFRENKTERPRLRWVLTSVGTVLFFLANLWLAIPQARVGFILNENCTLAGVDLRFFTCIAAELSGYNSSQNKAIYDCEISWCGGLIGNYFSDPQLPDDVLRPSCGGGALQVSGSNVSVTDCYMHHCGPMSLIVSIHAYQDSLLTYENLVFSKNLFEYCGAPLHIADLSKMDLDHAEGFISNLTFSDNIVMCTGGGWIERMVLQVSNETSGFFSSVENIMGASDNDGIYVTDNIFYISKSYLLCLTDNLWNNTGKASSNIVFEGNTYAQIVYDGLCVFNWKYFFDAGYEPYEQDFLDFIGDEIGKVVCIRYKSF